MKKAVVVSTLQIAPAFIFAAFVIYVFIFPLRTIEYTDKSLGVPSSAIAPGQVLPLKISYCKYANLSERIEGQLVSQDGDRLSKDIVTIDNKTNLQRNLQEGCHTISSNIWKVPSDTLPGHTYMVFFTITYTPNAFRTITVHSISAPFLVQGGK